MYALALLSLTMVMAMEMEKGKDGEKRGQGEGERTWFRFPSSLAYSSRTSCSSGDSDSIGDTAPAPGAEV